MNVWKICTVIAGGVASIFGMAWLAQSSENAELKAHNAIKDAQISIQKITIGIQSKIIDRISLDETEEGEEAA